MGLGVEAFNVWGGSSMRQILSSSCLVLRMTVRYGE